MWLTENQLKSVNFLNSAEDARLFVEGAEADERRPSRHPPLKKKGIEEFKYEVSMEKYDQLMKDGVILEASADVKGDDYNKVKMAMDEDSPPTKRPKKTVPQQKALEDMSAEEKAWWDKQQQRRKTLEAFRSAQTAAKRMTDKVRKATEDAQGKAERLVTEKNMPPEIRQHYMDALIPLMSQANELLNEYG